jgi:hypothetical protein
MEKEPRLASRIVPYSFAIISVVVVISLIDNGPLFWTSWRREYLLPAVVMIPLFAALIWLRWEWAPYAARKRAREREQKSS